MEGIGNGRVKEGELGKEKKEMKEEIGAYLEFCKPKNFANGRFIYSQVKDPNINLEFLNKEMFPDNQ